MVVSPVFPVRDTGLYLQQPGTNSQKKLLALNLASSGYVKGAHRHTHETDLCYRFQWNGRQAQSNLFHIIHIYIHRMMEAYETEHCLKCFKFVNNTVIYVYFRFFWASSACFAFPVERHWYRLTLTGNNKYVYTLIKSTLLLCGEKTLCCVTLISNTVQLTGDIPAQLHCCVCLQSVMKGG